MTRRVEFVSYNGKYPNLCSGDLVLKIDGLTVEFPKYGVPNKDGSWVYLRSCGSANWKDDTVGTGSWRVDVSPDLQDLSEEIEEVVNENIEHGCCGGCL